MPCWSIFEDQTPSYREEVLPRDAPTVSVEAGVTLGWSRYADVSVGIDRFGASAPGEVVLDKLGINAPNVVEHTLALLATRAGAR
jgi:transketolase